MRKVNKYLLGIFFILLLFVIGETMYYFYFSPKKSSTPTVNTQVVAPKNPLNPGTGAPRKPNITPIQVNQNDKAINYFIPMILQSLTKDVVVSSTIINEYTGVVKKINRQGGELGGGLKYEVELTIEGELKKPVTFYYLQSNLKNIKGLNDIKVGDKIKIKETLDATKDFRSNRLEIIITKTYNKP